MLLFTSVQDTNKNKEIEIISIIVFITYLFKYFIFLEILSPIVKLVFCIHNLSNCSNNSLGIHQINNLLFHKVKLLRFFKFFIFSGIFPLKSLSFNHNDSKFFKSQSSLGICPDNFLSFKIKISKLDNFHISGIISFQLTPNLKLIFFISHQYFSSHTKEGLKKLFNFITSISDISHFLSFL